MKYFFSILLISFAGQCICASAEIADEISTSVRSGNAKELSKYFADNVDLRLLEKENVYSKSQAELIVKDFFNKNTVKSFTIVHKSVPKNGTQYFIGTLETSGGKFRTYILIKKIGDKQLIQQFRIESENE